jgi:hypothetical protein
MSQKLRRVRVVLLEVVSRNNESVFSLVSRALKFESH